MKGDFTRSTFQASKHYSGVRLQQGRVQVDADWNEQVDIQTYRDRTEARDVIGQCGAPRTTPGFGVSAVGALAAVAAIDANGATAVGAGGLILAGRDGGDHWTRASVAASIANDLSAIQALPSGTAWAVGHGAAILRDAGKGSWTRQMAPAGTTADLMGIWAADNTRAWAVGSGGTLLTTTDGGLTWTQQTTPAGVASILRGVFFIDAARGWVVGDAGTLLATTDGGATWTHPAAPAGVATNLRAIWFVSATRGWIVGDGGTLLTTADGGATWTTQALPAGVTGSLRSVHFVSATQGLVVGDGGVIVMTTNGGANWTRATVPAGLTASLSGVRFGSATRAWAVGDAATLLISNDAGATWIRQLRTDDLMLGAGLCYVDGVLCQAEQPFSFLSQPDGGRVPAAPSAGAYVAYLDVWQRLITAVEDPRIREVALGGPDTATRTRTVWQVKLHRVGDPGAPLACAAFGDDWRPQPPTRPARLRAQGAPPAATDSACLVPPGGRYRRLENQLYRVEVHDGSGSTASLQAIVGGSQVQVDQMTLDGRTWQIGDRVEVFSRESRRDGRAPIAARVSAVESGSRLLTLDTPVAALSADTDRRIRRSANFTWSRDNANLVSDLVTMDPSAQRLVLADAGPDPVIGFASATWVEVCDEERILAGEPGALFEVDSVQGSTISVKTWPTGVTATTFASRPTVRRWDGRGDVTPAAVATAFTPLEDGVEIQFADGDYAPGQFWLIPARTLTADVEWPRDGTGAVFREPDGIDHRYCVLATLRFDGNLWTDVHDCRNVFPPLTQQTSFFYVGGDGQQAMPGDPLPQLLSVGVANGQWPVQGARVAFTALNGTVAADRAGLPGTLTRVEVATDERGIASCAWQLAANLNFPSQRVDAILLEGDGTPLHLPIHFSGQLSIAEQVAYRPGTCARLAGATTVARAIDRLAQVPSLTLVGGDGQSAVPPTPPAALLALPLPLRVGASNACGVITTDAAGQPRVRFEVVAGNGRVQGGGASADVPLDAQGVASCTWEIDGATAQQEVRAMLVDNTGQQVAGTLPLRFGATLRSGGQPPTEPGFHIVKEVDLAATGAPLLNDRPARLAELARGLRIISDAPVDGATLRGKPTCFVTLELPFPFNAADRQIFGDQVVAYTPLILEADTTADGEIMLWTPRPATAAWLANMLPQMLRGINRDRVLMHLTLKGNFISAQQRPDLHLDGDTFGTIDPTAGFINIDLTRGSGDGRRGGDFAMWFYGVG